MESLRWAGWKHSNLNKAGFYPHEDPRHPGAAKVQRYLIEFTHKEYVSALGGAVNVAFRRGDLALLADAVRRAEPYVAPLKETGPARHSNEMLWRAYQRFAHLLFHRRNDLEEARKKWKRANHFWKVRFKVDGQTAGDEAFPYEGLK